MTYFIALKVNNYGYRAFAREQLNELDAKKKSFRD